MGNAPAVSIQTTVASPVAPIPYLHHMMVSFVPEDATFLSNFESSTQPWMFLDPNTLKGLVMEVGPDTWRSRLLSLGASSSEPVWVACAAHFGALAVAVNGVRAAIPKPDVLYLGRRTRAVQSQNTVQFTSNTAGTIKAQVQPSKNLWTGQTPPGALAQTTVIADGVKTVGDLADELAANLTAIADFAAHYTAVSDGVDTVTVESIEDGYPLILLMKLSTPGPTIVHQITTANIAGNYADDLDDIQAAAELGELQDPPRRRYYWIKDLQLDDAVNAEGLEWVEDQGNKLNFTPIRDYIFWAHSASGARKIQNIGGAFLGNFDPVATASAAGLAAVANGGTGWTRGAVFDHPVYEYLGSALAGRTIAFKPGEVSFTAKVLQGDNAAARISPRDYGDNETLTIDRKFNYNSAEGPGLDGMSKWGYLCDGSFIDRKWLEDYVTWQVRVDVLEWMSLNDITTYTDAVLKAGAGVIARAIAKVPAVVPSTIGVPFLVRSQVNPAEIVARIYFGYTGIGISSGVINRFGTPSSPIPITIVDG